MTEEGRPENRVVWADLVRVYAVGCVVLLHTAAVPNTRFGEIRADWWWHTNLYTAFTCTCIPLLIMLSGALILPRYDWNAGTFFRRRLVKVLLPLPVWVAIYACWRKYAWNQPLGIGDYVLYVLGATEKPVFTHLWFLYLIISLYLLVPVLRLYVVNASRNNQLYFLGMWLVAVVVKAGLGERFGVHVAYQLHYFFGFTGYFLLGAYIVRFVPPRLGARLLWGCWAMLATGWVVTVIGASVLSSAAGKLDSYFYAEFSPTVILMSGASFLLLRHYGAMAGERSHPGAPFRKLLALASELSFGIYLVHALVIVVLESGRLGFTVQPEMGDPLLVAPLMAGIVVAASVAITWLLRSSRLTRWIVP